MALRILSLVVAMMMIASPVTAQAKSNLCDLLPDADVSAIVGTPVKVSFTGSGDTYKAGPGTVRMQNCVYEKAGGFGPTTVRVGIAEASSATIAAEWFKEEAKDYDLALAGKNKGQPLKGIADEGVAYPASGGVYVRKQNVVVHITVGRQDLDTQKEFDLSKQLAQNAVTRVK